MFHSIQKPFTLTYRQCCLVHQIGFLKQSSVCSSLRWQRCIRMWGGGDSNCVWRLHWPMMQTRCRTICQKLHKIVFNCPPYLAYMIQHKTCVISCIVLCFCGIVSCSWFRIVFCFSAAIAMVFRISGCLFQLQRTTQVF